MRSTNNCKWTTLASIGNDIIEDEDGVIPPSFPPPPTPAALSGASPLQRGQPDLPAPPVSSCCFSQVVMPHQWLEGNLPVSARCAVCDKACGSVRRLQDWRCLWCKIIVRGAWAEGCVMEEGSSGQWAGQAQVPMLALKLPLFTPSPQTMQVSTQFLL